MELAGVDRMDICAIRCRFIEGITRCRSIPRAYSNFLDCSKCCLTAVNISVAAERALEIGPTSDTAQVNYLLAVTREAVDLASRNPSFTVGGVRDIRDTVERAQLGVILQPS